MGNSKDATGALTATPTPTQTVADLQAGYDRIEQIGGLLRITSAQRQNLTASQTKIGWLIVETDTGRVYLRTADAPQGKLVHGRIVGQFGADGNAVLDSSTLELGADGWVDLEATPRRQGATDYSTSLILGVVPQAFRPAEDKITGDVVTFGNGTGNWATISASTGIVRLVKPAPAGDISARLKGRWKL